jgi:two-component sensor histidine kinase
MRPFEFFRRAIRPHPSFAEGLVRSLAAIAVPTLMRWLMDRGVNGAPFVLYFPPIQMIATYLGWRWGAFTAVGSGIAGAYFFIHPAMDWPFSWSALVLVTLFALSAGTMIVIGHLLRTAVLEIADRAQQSEDFNRELQHRTKNSLQMMRALASQASKATDPAEFYEKLGGRLGALAKANELLRFGALRSCDMNQLVEAAVAPFGGDQIVTRGPECQVSRDACTSLVMALHELGTNAHKYGALAVPQGRVELVWSLVDDGEIEMSWTETGGPPVAPPTRKGLGSRLLSAQRGMRAVALEFLPQGVTCRMTIGRGRPIP